MRSVGEQGSDAVRQNILEFAHEFPSTCGARRLDDTDVSAFSLVLRCPTVGHWQVGRNGAYGYNHQYLGDVERVLGCADCLTHGTAGVVFSEPLSELAARCTTSKPRYPLVSCCSNGSVRALAGLLSSRAAH